MDGAGTAPCGPSELAVLAAVRRAALHEDVPADGGVTLRALGAHLSIPARGSAARSLRGTLAKLTEDGALRRRRARGVELWQLAPAGRRALEGAARAGRRPALPESPLHREWREARLAGGRELPRLAARLAAELADAERMLVRLRRAETPPSSDAWLALGPRLLDGCRRLGSAWHCLHEWPEPRDEQPQRDGPRPRDPLPRDAAVVLRAGRRNVALWAEEDAGA